MDVWTLEDGAQSSETVAERLAAYLGSARQTIDIAIYDFALSPGLARPIIDAVREAKARGVAIRLAHNVDHGQPVPIPPPPHTDADLLAQLGVPVKPVPGIPHLMHHKYVVVDSGSVWTGSTNWTDDSWNREENVVAVVRSAAIAAGFLRDFEQLWARGEVEDTGAFDVTEERVENVPIRPWFSPGRGTRIAHRIASAVAHARTRVRICSPVITSGPILGTLAEVAASGSVDLAGVYDATQMDEVFEQWRREHRSTWKTGAFHSVIGAADFVGKRSTPWTRSSIHDFMHAKFVVADDRVVLGSYNFSHSAADNAENVLEFADHSIADRLASFCDHLRDRYRGNERP